MQHKKLFFTIIAFFVMLSLFTVSASAMEARSLLTEKDQKIYDSLKAQIERVASGEEASSVFTVEFPGFQSVWTFSVSSGADRGRF